MAKCRMPKSINFKKNKNKNQKRRWRQTTKPARGQ